MKRIILATAASLCVLTTSVAYGENYIDLFADPGMTQCSLVDNGSFTPVYVFLRGSDSATGVQFAAPVPACWEGATWVGDGFPGDFAKFENTQTGIDVFFGACKRTPVLVCTMYFTTTGAARSCCDMVVFPATVYGNYGLQYIGCNFVEYDAFAGHKLVINPNASCQCSGPLATEPTTWGRVKSLYR